MAAKYDDVQELLRKKADINARLSLLAYDGTPEIKNRGNGKYLYTRKRVSGKLTSTYVGVYSDDLYNLLLRNASESRQLRKELRAVVRQLANAGYSCLLYTSDAADELRRVD
ncbi:MAG: cell filamentation protein Fic, partial [Lactobacillus iners]|nr:cell filamentation protein Fic [Lactobacillus iners]MCT7707426.1 cell filamentation protein Fic [Lactobacillus iners]